MDLDSWRPRFVDGLAAAAGVDRTALDRPGTTVVGREDRVGSGAVFCYRVGSHLLVWADPAVVGRVRRVGLVDDGREAVPGPALARLATRAGLELATTVVSNLLASAPPRPGAPAGGFGYRHRRLRSDAAGLVDAVRAFTERCDPDDVEAAALDELDDFAEAAINVVLGPDGAETGGPAALPIVAWASASTWGWDEGLADIGVLVHRDHRGRGLARLTVAATVADLLAGERVPLYRHEVDNAGSRAVAASIGFRPVATLDYFVTRST